MLRKILDCLFMLVVAIAILGLCYLGWKFQMATMALRFYISAAVGGILILLAIIFTLFSK